jgi:hypothetical protein
VAPFFSRQLEHEIRGKAISVALHGLVKNFCRRPVKGGQVGIENHFLPAQRQNEGIERWDGFHSLP